MSLARKFKGLLTNGTLSCGSDLLSKTSAFRVLHGKVEKVLSSREYDEYVMLADSAHCGIRYTVGYHEQNISSNGYILLIETFAAKTWTMLNVFIHLRWIYTNSIRSEKS